MDRVGVAITRRPRLYDPIFSEGWGDLDAIPVDVDPLSPPRVVEAAQRGSALADELRFRSPIASHLPADAQTVRVRVSRPRNASRILVVFAAFNDHGFRTRWKLAQELAGSSIGAAIVEAPFYGARRIRQGQAIATVADLLLLGAGVVSESIALARWFREAGWTVGFGGYSMGGSMAAYAAAATDLPVAIAPMAASYSPSAVYVDAVLAQAVAWDRLGPDGRNRLGSVLDRVSTLNLRPPSQAATAVFLAAESDGYVPLPATKALVNHFSGSELRIVPGGHASLASKRDLQVEVIREAFERFERWNASERT